MHNLMSPESASALVAASGLHPPLEQHVISTPTRGQRHSGGAAEEGRRGLGSNIVTEPCDVCEGMGEDGDRCCCGLHMSEDDYLCYHCEESHAQCTCYRE